MEKSNKRWKKPLGYSAAGALILFVATAVMNAEQGLTNEIWKNYLTLSVGLAMGILGRNSIDRRPSLLLIVPLIAIAIGLALD